MLGGLTVEDLIELRLQLIYAAQKAEHAFVAMLSQQHREKNSANYTADQLKAGKAEVEHAHFMIRGSAIQMLPELNALAEEVVPR